MEQARVAMCHAFNIAAKADLAPLLPTGIYTIPEVSMVGATEEVLQQQGVDFIAGRARYADNPRGRIIGDDTGLLKLLFRRDDMRLLGIHVIGEQATEVAHLGLLALLTESGADLFNRACFNYPTLGELYKYATYDALLQRELAGAAPYFVRHLALAEGDVGSLAVPDRDGQIAGFPVDHRAPGDSQIGALHDDRIVVRGRMQYLHDGCSKRRADLLLGEVDPVDRVDVGFGLQGTALALRRQTVVSFLDPARQRNGAIEITGSCHARERQGQNENGSKRTHEEFSRLPLTRPQRSTAFAAMWVRNFHMPQRAIDAKS